MQNYSSWKGENTMKFTKIAIILFSIILIISSYILIKNFLEYKDSNDSNKELIDEVITKEENKEKIKIDWGKLQKINKDIIGWIKIENTNIDYPILKDNNNLKYLKYSYDGKYNNNGSIFTLNVKPFEENITIVYGHNMKSGLMFSDLSKYIKRDFFNEHSSFEIYTKNQNYKATAFSFYSIGINEEENNIKSLDFDEEIEYYKNKSYFDINNIGKIKKIIKLSTCSYINNHTVPTNQRYYLVAKLEEID